MKYKAIQADSKSNPKSINSDANSSKPQRLVIITHFKRLAQTQPI